MLGAYLIDDVRESWIFRPAVADQPDPQIGIGPLEHVRECVAHRAIGFFVARRQPPAEQSIELARAAAAAPAEAVDVPIDVVIHESCRSPLPLAGEGWGEGKSV